MKKTIIQKTIRPVLLGAALLLGAMPVMAEESPWKDGIQVYAKVCGHCHETGVGPVLKGRNLHPAYITAIARQGFRAMPAMRASFIDDDALQSVAEFINKSPVSAEKE